MAIELRFRMAITADEASRYYRGAALSVVVQAENGQKIQFPARYIRPFIDQAGVRGLFKIRFDDNHKLLALERVGD